MAENSVNLEPVWTTDELREKCTGVFALIVTEPASVSVKVCWVGVAKPPPPPPKACFVTIYPKKTVHCAPDSSMVWTMVRKASRYT